MINIIIEGVLTAFITLYSSNKIRSNAIKSSFDSTNEILPPPYNISIVMPSYNEENLIGYALESLKNQNILKQYPEYFELILVDSNSNDNTVNIAKNYVDKIVYAPKGKLTARNLALSYINGNIIVSVDADSFYPPNWLNLMIKQFENLNIVGESGLSLDNFSNLPDIINKFHPLASYISNHTINKFRMCGRNSAYYKHLQVSEPFNENIDQTNIREMVNEEEINFGKKLSKYGTVIFNERACCLHLGSIKYECRNSNFNPVDEINKLYCDDIKNKERF